MNIVARFSEPRRVEFESAERATIDKHPCYHRGNTNVCSSLLPFVEFSCFRFLF